MTAPAFDVSREFAFPLPSGDEGKRLAEEVGEVFQECAEFLVTNLPQGRLKSLTMTTLQEAFHWAVASANLDSKDD